MKKKKEKETNNQLKAHELWITAFNHCTHTQQNKTIHHVFEFVLEAENIK